MTDSLDFPVPASVNAPLDVDSLEDNSNLHRSCLHRACSNSEKSSHTFETCLFDASRCRTTIVNRRSVKWICPNRFRKNSRASIEPKQKLHRPKARKAISDSRRSRLILLQAVTLLDTKTRIRNLSYLREVACCYCHCCCFLLQVDECRNCCRAAQLVIGSVVLFLLSVFSFHVRQCMRPSLGTASLVRPFPVHLANFLRRLGDESASCPKGTTCRLNLLEHVDCTPGIEGRLRRTMTYKQNWCAAGRQGGEQNPKVRGIICLVRPPCEGSSTCLSRSRLRVAATAVRRKVHRRTCLVSHPNCTGNTKATESHVLEPLRHPAQALLRLGSRLPPSMSFVFHFFVHHSIHVLLQYYRFRSGSHNDRTFNSSSRLLASVENREGSAGLDRFDRHRGCSCQPGLYGFLLSRARRDELPSALGSWSRTLTLILVLVHSAKPPNEMLASYLHAAPFVHIESGAGIIAAASALGRCYKVGDPSTCDEGWTVMPLCSPHPAGQFISPYAKLHVHRVNGQVI